MNVGDTHARQGRTDAALEDYQTSLALWKGLGSIAGQAWARLHVGAAYERAGWHDLARSWLEDALPGLRVAGDNAMEAEALYLLARTALGLGDPAAACDIALTLVERFAEDVNVTPRGAIAYGELVVRGGDYYGPTVNLAARLAFLGVGLFLFGPGSGLYIGARLGTGPRDGLMTNLAERGYSRTSVRHIAEAAGVSAQTVYDSVGSKQELVARLPSEYERAYFAGLVAERRARALLSRSGPGRALPAGDLLREAMKAFERAEAVKPSDNDDALLRWNACARLFARHPELGVRDEERTAPVMLE